MSRKQTGVVLGPSSNLPEVATIVVQLQGIVGMLNMVVAFGRQPCSPRMSGLLSFLNMRSRDLQKIKCVMDDGVGGEQAQGLK